MKVDSREPKRIARWFRKRGWTVTHAKFADCADIADDDLSVLFERKHRTDIIASIHDGRLFSQCDRLFNYCESHDAMGFVVISGDLTESITAYSNIIRKALRKQGKKMPPKWRLNINAAQIYKYISMIPWHYDVNILWYITEEEALEAIHYMLQELHVSDPYSRTLNKRRKSKSKRAKKPYTVRGPSKVRNDILPPTEEVTYEYFVKLGLIDDE